MNEIKPANVGTGSILTVHQLVGGLRGLIVANQGAGMATSAACRHNQLDGSCFVGYAKSPSSEFRINQDDQELSETWKDPWPQKMASTVPDRAVRGSVEGRL